MPSLVFVKIELIYTKSRPNGAIDKTNRGITRTTMYYVRLVERLDEWGALPDLAVSIRCGVYPK